MGATKKVRKEQQHRIGYADEKVSPRRPKPASSHPDADSPSAKPLATATDLDEHEGADPHRKAIVSINGEDVQESPVRWRAA